MKNRINILLILVCVTIGMIAGRTVVAAEPPHPYHVSMAEVNWNPKTQKFEVALCLWPADLEKALARQTGRPIDLAKEPDVDRLIEAYVAKRFTIRSTHRTADQTEPQQPTSDVPGGDSSSSEIGDSQNGVVAAAEEDEPASEATPTIQTVVITPAAVAPAKDTPKPSKIKWYGHEADAKKAWLYFEVSGDARANWSVENRVFFELNDDQLNHVQWKGTGKTETLVCDADNATISLEKK